MWNNNTIKSNGASFNDIVFDGTGGEWTLYDALTVSGAFTLTKGTLDTNGNALSVGSYSQTDGAFTAGASTITCTGNFSVTGGTFTAGASTLILDASGGDTTFTGGGYTFYTITFTIDASIEIFVIRSSSSNKNI